MPQLTVPKNNCRFFRVARASRSRTSARSELSVDSRSGRTAASVESSVRSDDESPGSTARLSAWLVMSVAQILHVLFDLFSELCRHPGVADDSSLPPRTTSSAASRCRSDSCSLSSRSFPSALAPTSHFFCIVASVDFASVAWLRACGCSASDFSSCSQAGRTLPPSAGCRT